MHFSEVSDPNFIDDKICFASSREFTHRVKSVSMAKFTAQEVSALQEGGNEVTCPLFFFFHVFYHFRPF